MDGSTGRRSQSAHIRRSASAAPGLAAERRYRDIQRPTRCFSSVQEAFEPIREETWGRMCNKVICAMGVGQGSMMLDIMALVAKNGRAVITNIHPATETQVNLSLLDLTTMQKQIVGALFGSSNIRYDIPHLLEVYRRGYVDLDAMITSRYKLDEINQGYQDLRDGKNVRGVLIYE